MASQPARRPLDYVRSLAYKRDEIIYYGSEWGGVAGRDLPSKAR